ncbi:hypothetical protein C7402_115270, partial [Paraburkholderia unamae]
DPLTHAMPALCAERFSRYGHAHRANTRLITPKVVRTRARGFDRDCPHGVFQGFQVMSHETEPVSRCRNLFSKEDCRASLLDEPVPRRPEVSRVIKPKSFACDGERLTRTGTGPNRSVVRPPGNSKRARPSSKAGEEMALCVSAKVIRSDIFNAPFINVAGSDVPGSYQVAQPLRGVGFDLVVIRGHAVSMPLRVGSQSLESTDRLMPHFEQRAGCQPRMRDEAVLWSSTSCLQIDTTHADGIAASRL